MRTILGKIFVRFDWKTYPATGWLFNKAEQRKEKISRSSTSYIISPDSYNVRGVSARSQDKTRRNAAP